MTSCPLLDPTAACHRLDLTDRHDPAPTTSRRVLHYQPMDTQVCPYLDQWEEILDLVPPTDTRCSTGQCLDTSWIPGVHRRHTSVPLHLITLDRCLLHMVCSAFLSALVWSLSSAGTFVNVLNFQVIQVCND